MSGLLDDLFDPADGYEAEAFDGLTRERPRRAPRFLTADQLGLHPPTMLVRGWMPRNAVTVLAGPPGSGKGVVVADLVARGSRADQMPNGDTIPRPFRTIIVAGPGEDSAEDWHLRLVAAGANVNYTTRSCQTAFGVARGRLAFELMKLLVELGADPDADRNCSSRPR